MTSQTNEHRSVPSIALARMAMIVAGADACGDGDIQFWNAVWKPIPREAAEESPQEYSYSDKYYRIIDDIARQNALALDSPGSSDWWFYYSPEAYPSALKDVQP